MSEKNASFGKARAIGLACAIVLLLITSSICTQFAADRSAYHPALGEPLFGKVYNPFNWWAWSVKFYDYAPATYSYAFLIFGIGAMFSMLVFALVVGVKSRSSRKHEGIHGTAHFATPEEVERIGLINSGKGVYCGGFCGKNSSKTYYLRDDSSEHVCVIAPTGSGKGVGLVIPTLLSWPDSVFVLDIKGENYAITAGWRQKNANNVVLRFDPAEAYGSCAWNPLEEIRFGTDYEVSDAQNIALMVIDDDGKGISGSYWRAAAYDLLTDVIIHALYKAASVGRPPCLSDIAYMLSGEGDFATANDESENDFDDGELPPLAGLFEEMRNVRLEENNPVARNAQLKINAGGRRFGETASKELSGIVSTANAALGLYKESNVGKNTSRSDFKVADLMDFERPVSLYFIATPESLGRLKPLTRLLLTRIVAGLTGRMEYEAGRAKTMHKHRLLMMLDEFPALGRLDMFEKALAFIRGYGIKAYIITQDVQQLYQAYTNFESIISNCRVRIAYAPNKFETAEWLSKMAGQTTVIKEEISTSGNRFGTLLKNVSRSYREIQRPLMTPDEIMRLPMAEKDRHEDVISPGEMLVFVAGHPVIRGRQILYFLDPVFNRRSRIAPPEKSDAIRKAAV